VLRAVDAAHADLHNSWGGGPGGLFAGTVASSVTSITAKFGTATVEATVKPTGTARSIWVLPINMLWSSPTVPVSIEATSAAGQPLFAQESARAAQQISSSVRSTAAFSHQHHMTFAPARAGGSRLRVVISQTPGGMPSFGGGMYVVRGSAPSCLPALIYRAVRNAKGEVIGVEFVATGPSRK